MSLFSKFKCLFLDLKRADEIQECQRQELNELIWGDADNNCANEAQSFWFDSNIVTTTSSTPPGWTSISISRSKPIEVYFYGDSDPVVSQLNAFMTNRFLRRQ